MWAELQGRPTLRRNGDRLLYSPIVISFRWGVGSVFQVKVELNTEESNAVYIHRV